MADEEILRRIDAHMARGNELMAEIREEHRLTREEHERNRRFYADLSAKNAEVVADNKAVMRNLVGEIRTMRDENRVHHEAMTGALLDLAAEIRSWGGGPAAA